MSDALKNYAKSSFFFEGENYIVKDKEGVPFELNKHVLEWDGNTVFEKCHPTFISKKRKVILTCPRKVGHSSIRFYLNAQNAFQNDDWVWIEDNDRDPKNFLDEDDANKMYEELLTSDSNNRINTTPKSNMERPTDSSDYHHFYSSDILWNQDREKINEYFGKENSITWPQDLLNNSEFDEVKESSFYPPFQTVSPLKEYTSYLVVRDPWERFISGLITEMDNGLLNPWKYDRIANSEEGWELLYNSCKRILYFTEPEYLMVGGLDGPQASHTFLLSRPLWKGKSMFDIYDKLIHYKHNIEYRSEPSGYVGVNHDSLKKDTGVIGTLVELGFISQDVTDKWHKERGHDMYSHTHVNITPHIRQHVISELQNDEDLKDWWSRCRELVDIEYECLKNNKHKF